MARGSEPTRLQNRTSRSDTNISCRSWQNDTHRYVGKQQEFTPSGSDIRTQRCYQRAVWVNEQELKKMLQSLQSEHRDLDAAIAALTESGSGDQMQIARLKKRKLRLKDQISAVEDQLIPDIIA